MIDNGICDADAYNKACNFDGSDCLQLCPFLYLVGNGECNMPNNLVSCNFDGGDCCGHGNFGNPDKIGDNICNDENNIGQCSYDGGDCCMEEVGVGRGRILPSRVDSSK